MSTITPARYFRRLLLLLLVIFILFKCDTIFDIIPPKIKFISPKADTAYFGALPVELDVTDNGKITKVELFLEDESIYEFSKGPYETEINLNQINASSITLKAVAHDRAGNYAEANRKVSLSPGFKLTSPNGGESWAEQSTQAITWTSSGNVGDNVGLYYSLDGALSWTEIINPTPNDGYHEWTLPNLLETSSESKVIVSSNSTSSADTSNNYFGIIDIGIDDQMQKLTASDAQSEDYFGRSVAISGDVAIVGAYGEDSGGVFAGAAYVFQGGGGSWTQVAKLTASDAESVDNFGYSVAINGDMAIVGALGEDSGGDVAGAAYVFQGSGGSWTQVAKLTASDAQSGDRFGISVAISGDVATVGADAEDSGGDWAGAAYVFQGNSGSWIQVAKLTASDAQSGDQFGSSVGISEGGAIVGAWAEDTGGEDAGSAYVFQDNGGSWTQVAKLTASDAESGDEFGCSVAISGDVAIVGARGEDSGGDIAGAAYIFQGSGGSWSQVAKLTASDSQRRDRFGISVAISGDVAVVGAPWEDSGGEDAGAAYVFQSSDGSWTQVAKLTASDAESGDLFGTSVAISGDVAIVGADHEDNGGTRAGAAYVFK